MRPEPVPVLRWADFLRRFDWRQGEHVSILGRTGRGKTTLALELARRRRYVMALATKPRDSTLDRLTRPPDKFRKIEKWPPPLPAAFMPRLLVWPKYRTPADVAVQSEVMSEAIDAAFIEGGWCILADECYYLAQDLRLREPLRHCWQQGRALDLSLLAISQRPSGVPLEMYSQATHLFLFRSTLQEDLKRLSEIPGGIDPVRLRRIVKTLSGRRFVYLNTQTDAVLISELEL